MERRHFGNPNKDYTGGDVQVDKVNVRNLIYVYVETILKSTRPGSAEDDERGDLYVGNAGIAYMFWKLHRSNAKDLFPAIEHAKEYITNAKNNALKYKKRTDERCAYLCGNAGIYAISAAISHEQQQTTTNNTLDDEIRNFSLGFEACTPVAFTRYGCDEVLVGRAGYLSGCYWLNSIIEPKPFNDNQIIKVCESIINSGRQYAQSTKAPLPLMYQYHGTEYLGAAHGLCAILHMLLESPWFKGVHISETKLNDIRRSIDFYLSLQDSHGNFPTALEDLKTGREKRLIHWCHGAPGAIYLLAKSYLVFKDEKYLTAAIRAADLVWQQGLLLKGPGICHGVAGNGYVFLLMYRLTQEQKYLYRAIKFMEFLKSDEFKTNARTPDRPFSLYEGLAGTVCFLIDLLDPSQASFPFMDVFS